MTPVTPAEMQAYVVWAKNHPADGFTPAQHTIVLRAFYESDLFLSLLPEIERKLAAGYDHVAIYANLYAAAFQMGREFESRRLLGEGQYGFGRPQ